MRDTIDLHTHTTHSDGTYSPTELVRMVSEAGVGVLSITDHDSVGAVPEASAACEKLGITFVPGTELTVYHEGREIHLLGYFVDVSQPWFTDLLLDFQEHRMTRMKRMVRRLDEVGVHVSMEDVKQEINGSIGRPHLARALIAKGYCTTIAQAFRQYLVPGKPGYAEKFQITLARGIEIIHKAGGLAVMAHPGISTDSDEAIILARTHGMDGIEAYHSDHSPTQMAHYTKLADEHGLIPTGGSDFHGGKVRSTARLGNTNVPADTYTRLLACRDTRLPHPDPPLEGEGAG